MNQQTNPADPINSLTTDIENSKPIDAEQSNSYPTQVSKVESSPTSEEDIDFNEFAGFNPNIPLSLEAQYQLAQDEEKPLPPPISERGIPRMVVMLLLTGGVILLGLVIWEFVKPKSAIKPIAQTTPKETKESPIKDEKPELLARLAYVDQQKLVAQNPKTERQPQTEPEAKPTPPPVAKRSTPRQAAAKNPTPPPRTIVRTVTVPGPPPPPKTIVRTVTVPGPPPPPKTIVRTVTVPAPTPEPTPKQVANSAPTTEKVDPFERWNQLAQLGQTRGNVESDSSIGLQNASTPTGADTPSEAPSISEIQVSSINRLGNAAEESALSGSLPTSSDRTSEFLTVAIGNSPQNKQLARTNLSPGAIGILTRTPQSLQPTETAQVTLGTTASGTDTVPEAVG